MLLRALLYIIYLLRSQVFGLFFDLILTNSGSTIWASPGYCPYNLVFQHLFENISTKGFDFMSEVFIFASA